ncbi:MAG: rhomboid family intramembrane serine protease [Paracoccaceae bacterium]
MSRSDRTGRIAPAIWVLAALSALPELVLAGADLGLWGHPDWRGIAIEYGGFWSGLLGNWRPNFAAQPWTMFLSYGFLHAGFWHLALNLLTLLSLGPPLVRRMGALRFIVLYLAAQVGGGLAFAAVSSAAIPMIGASGALFGLAGAWLALDYNRRLDLRQPIWPVIRVCLWLIALNLIMWWALARLLAWETHLGGFLAGWFFVVLSPNRR